MLVKIYPSHYDKQPKKSNDDKKVWKDAAEKVVNKVCHSSPIKKIKYCKFK
jgi:hypothetical protein